MAKLFLNSNLVSRPGKTPNHASGGLRLQAGSGAAVASGAQGWGRGRVRRIANDFRL